MKTLESQRLILRNFRSEDLSDLFEYLSDKDVLAFEPYEPMTLDETRDSASREKLIFVRMCSSGKTITEILFGKIRMSMRY